MPSSATSPAARRRASGIDGARRLANTIDSRSGALATSSRTICRTSGDSSTRWKSSRIRTAPCSAIAGSSRQEHVSGGVAGRARPRQVAEQRGGLRRELRVVVPPGGDEVAQERDPVAVVFVEAVPQRPKAGPPREVGQQRRLAVAGVRQDQDHALMDLGARASRAGGRAPGSRREAAAPGPSRAGSGTRSYRRRAPCALWRRPSGGPGRRRRAAVGRCRAWGHTGEEARTIRMAPRGVNGGLGSGHGAIVARAAQPPLAATLRQARSEA